MEKTLKEREQTAKISMVPLDFVPLTAIPAATNSTKKTKDGAKQLTKAVENLSIQTQEIKKMQDQVKVLQEQRSRTKASHPAETQRAQKLIEKLQKSERESAIGYTLAQAKEIIWEDIMNSIAEIWPCIQIIFEQKELIKRAFDVITNIKQELREMPTTTTNIIKFLKSKNIYELDDLGVDDRTKTIL